jgi:hypothetical protein
VERAVVEVDSGANSGRHTSDVQPGLIIFTKRYYSTVFVRGFAPRPQLSDSAKDDELGRVFSPFTANAGTYQRTDSSITFTPIVAKNPAFYVREISHAARAHKGRLALAQWRWGSINLDPCRTALTGKRRLHALEAGGR